MRSSSTSSTMMGMMSGGGMELDLQEYMAIDAYEASGPSQLSFEVGEVIMILDKMEDGTCINIPVQMCTDFRCYTLIHLTSQVETFTFTSIIRK